MNLICEFLNEKNIFIGELDGRVTKQCEEFDESFEKDSSEFCIVDGEEGDYGKIHYLYEGKRVATHIIHGGDDEDVEFTEYGYEMVKERAIELLMFMLK